MRHLLLSALALLLALNLGAQEAQKREMRTVWVATVSNIDWPQTRGTGATIIAKQKKQLTDLLDGFEAANMNAICLQVRDMSDAFYQSSYEPWSSYITGTRGLDPGWDPLAFAVEECHKRGLECHAWVNPYRFSNNYGNDWNTPQDIELKNSGLLMQVDKYVVFNPGLEGSRQRVVNVCREMIENYDIDGIIFDDYFYPGGGTPTNSSAPDYELWQQSGTTLSLADWRRANVNLMVRNVYDMVQDTRPGVKFAIGPAGVAGTRSTSAGAHGVDPCPTGSDWQYNTIYSDPLAWLEEGTIDYISPQLYWKTDHPTNPFGPLTQWWSYIANHYGRHHYASHNIYFMESTNTQADWDEILQQIRYSRQYNMDNAPGVNFYSAKYINGPACSGFGTYLSQTLFTHKALAPALTWKTRFNLGVPQHVTLTDGVLTWDDAGVKPVKYGVYAIPTSIPVDEITSEQFEGIKSDYLIKVSFSNTYELPQEYQTGYWYAVTQVDGWGNEYEPAYVNAPAGEADEVTLVTPADAAVVAWEQPFDWTDAANARYRLQISADQDFAQLLFDIKHITHSDTTLRLTALASTTTYYWRVITQQSGHFDKPSQVRTFVTPEREKAGLPVLLTPVDGAEIESKIRFECTNAQSDLHILQVATDSTFADIKYVCDSMKLADGCRYCEVEPSLLGKGKFYWRVVTRADGYDDNMTRPWSFNITHLDVGNIEPGYVLKHDVSDYKPIGRLTLTNKWVRSVKEGYENITFNGGGLMNRGFTVKDGKVLVIGRSEGSPDADVFILHYSAETGELLKTVPVDPIVKCNYYPGNDIFQDEAGHVLISNLILYISTTPIYLFHVDPETGAATQVASLMSSQASTRRVDHCNVYGDIMARSFDVYAAMSNGTEVVHWQVGGNGSGQILGTDVMTAQSFYPTSADYFGLAPRVYPISNEEIFVTGGSTHLSRYKFDTGEMVDAFDKNPALCPEGTEANGAAFFTLMGKNYMLYPYGDFRSTLGFRFMLAESDNSQFTESQGDNSQFSILNSQFSNFHATWIFPQQGLGKVNSSTWDAPCCVTDGDQPNQKNLYIYVPGNGIAAYTLTAGVLGDVNGDGKVDIADVNAVINMMLGLTPSPSPEGEGSPADVTGDSQVDIADINAVINIMLGKG